MPKWCPQMEQVRSEADRRLWWKRFDAYPPLYRAFINEYGTRNFAVWRESYKNMPLPDFEIAVRKAFNLHTTTEAVVCNEHKSQDR